MRVLEPSDDLGLAVEAPDELGIVGEFGANHLDGHFAAQGRLARPIDPAERAFSDLLTELIAAELPTGGSQLLQGWVAVDYALFEAT